jgi:pimeloyl-ACP methyl ester carboxylesterase
MLLSLALCGAVFAFLKYNWSPSRVFMGDAGSLCLGFSLTFLSIAITQKEGSVVSPVAPLLVLALPVTDTVTVMIKRMMRGRSPFHADKYHFHHILLRFGFDKKGAVRVILILSSLLSGAESLRARGDRWGQKGSTDYAQMCGRAVSAEDKRRWLNSDYEALHAVYTLNLAIWPATDIPLSSIRVPCLLYAGELDVLYDGAKKAAQHIQSGTFISIPGLGHEEVFEQSLAHLNTMCSID